MPKSSPTIRPFQRDPNTIPDIITTRGRSVSYEDTSFVTGDSPVVLDIATDLSRNARDGYVAVDGAGDIAVEISDDSTNYGGSHVIKAGEILELGGVDIARVRLTWVSNSSYRCFFI